MARILVVEDCPDSRALVEHALGEVHDLVPAESVAEALESSEGAPFDMALVDLSLPDGDGFRVCSLLQNQPCTRDVPIFFLTASSDIGDKVTAFQLGAADYLEKPFHAAELRARIDARLRIRDEVSHEGMLAIADLTLDPVRFRAHAHANGDRREVHLTPHEFQVLRYLASHPDEVITRKALLEEVWGRIFVSRRTVDTHISNVRRKLGPTRIAIEAVRGVGYRLRILGREGEDRDFLTEG